MLIFSVLFLDFGDWVIVRFFGAAICLPYSVTIDTPVLFLR